MASDTDTWSSSEHDDKASSGPLDEWASVISPEIDHVSPSISDDSPRSTTPEQESPTVVTMTARAYQLEMLEESLKRNIIVAVCFVIDVLAMDFLIFYQTDGYRKWQDSGVGVMSRFGLDAC
jgi:hypothetical protein